MNDSTDMSYLGQVMDEIRKAKQDITGSLEALLAKRQEVDSQIAGLERELAMLDHLSHSRPDDQPRHHRSNAEPLSRRVLDILRQNNSELTFRDIREFLKLDRRESRNLGPVLNQLAKIGKIVSTGRGMPWRLADNVAVHADAEIHE